MKKILYLHQYFITPAEGGTVRSYHIAKKLVERGNTVDMITSHNKPIYEKKLIEGITVHYLPIFYSNHLTTFKRYISFIKFTFAAVHFSKTLAKPDIVFATSTPLTVGIFTLWLKKFRKIPYIFEVRDLWPEAPIQLKVIRFPLLKYISKILEKAIYKNAEKIIALSPGIENGIKQRYPNAETYVIPNMSDIDFFEDMSPKTLDRKEFIVGYFGAFGKANHLEYVLDLAESCQKANLPVSFHLAGDGDRKKNICEEIRRRGLENIYLFAHQNRFEIKNSMLKVDACLTSFKKIPVLETGSPNKFFDGLAAKKLSIINTQGWLKELVEKYKCGIYIDPEHPEKFPELIKPFLNDSSLLRKYQQNGQQPAKELFSKEELTNQVCDILESEI